jgi:hypothetical protein
MARWRPHGVGVTIEPEDLMFADNGAGTSALIPRRWNGPRLTTPTPEELFLDEVWSRS